MTLSDEAALFLAVRGLGWWEALESLCYRPPPLNRQYYENARGEKQIMWWPSSGCIPDCEPINERRIMWAQHRDEMISFQKEAGKAGDRDTARFFKDEAAEAMKHYRACCLLLGYFHPGVSGDSPYRDLRDWPKELFDALDAEYVV